MTWLIAGVTAVIAASPAWAQNRDKAWEVSPYVGWVMFGDPHLGDDHTVFNNPSGTPPTMTTTDITSKIDDSGSFGFRFGYNWTKHHMVEFGFDGTSTNGIYTVHEVVKDTTPPPPDVTTSDTTKSENVSVDLIMAHANYVYNFFLTHRGRIVPFVGAGIGILNSSIFGQTADPDLQPTLDVLVGDENVFMYNYGGGIRFFGSEKVGVRFDAREVRYTSGSRGSQNHLELGLGLTLILGGA